MSRLNLFIEEEEETSENFFFNDVRVWRKHFWFPMNFQIFMTEKGRKNPLKPEKFD